MRPPGTEREARRLLRRLGCRRAAWARTRQRWFVLLLLSFAAFAVTSLLVRQRLDTKSPLELGAVVALGAAVFTIIQWRSGLEQKSTESYEKEIEDAAAKSTKSWQAVMRLLPCHYPKLANPEVARPEGGRRGQVIAESRRKRQLERLFQETAYVYLTLDHLEFALERYELGFVSGYTASREVMTFRSKLDSVRFRERTKECVRAASYSAVVHRVVERLIADAATNPPPMLSPVSVDLDSFSAAPGIEATGPAPGGP